MYYIFDILLNYNLLYVGLAMMVLLYLVSNYWQSHFYQYFFTKKYIKIQWIHDREVEVPRLGGLVIFGMSAFWVFILNPDKLLAEFIGKIIICSLPLILVSLKEDLFHNVKPGNRLLSIILSAVLLLVSQPYGLPIIDMPVIGILMDNSFISLLFFVLALSGYTNGVNLIDGSNGIASATIIASLSSICFLSFMQNDLLLLQSSLIFVFFILFFSFFNYPWGKVFLGDSGAYFLGLLTGYITIIFFARHPEVPTWAAVLILFYPSFEMIFSIIRKLRYNKNPFYPDSDHLHLKLFYLINNSIKRSRVANGMVMPLLTLFWLSPPALVPWVYTHVELSLLSIIFLMILYLGFYWALPRFESYEEK